MDNETKLALDLQTQAGYRNMVRNASQAHYARHCAKANGRRQTQLQRIIAAHRAGKL